MVMGPQFGKEGETILLSCSCNDTTATPRWFKGGSEILPSEKYSFQVVDGNFVLVIKDAKKADDGDYRIIVEEVQASAKLTIQSMTPRKNVISLQQPEDANEDDNVKIICLSDDTSVKPRWFINEQEIFPSDKYIFEIFEGKYVLVIRDSSLKDAGPYKIVVGEEEASVHLTIKG